MLTKNEETLLKAIRNRDLEKVDKALNAGARVGHPVYALQHAIAHHGDLNLVQRLLNAGADPKCVGRGVRSPLATAAEVSEPEIVDLLLRLGAPINYRGLNRLTPLMLAVVGTTKDSEECVSMLLSAGANTLLKDRYGKDAMDLAKQHGNLVAMKLIAPYVEAELTRDALVKHAPHASSKRLHAQSCPRI